jgi:cysteine desulfurase/selenocysteine lyase
MTGGPSSPRPLDPAAIRRDFPILSREIYPGKRLVYLDNAATTQKPTHVLDALDAFHRQYNANVHRAIHRLAELATDAYERARHIAARFVNAPNEQCVIFTRGTTEAINLVAHAWGSRHIRAGDAIILTEMEHHSNLVPWQMLAARTGANLRFVPVLETGELDLEVFERLLNDRVKLVSFTHVSNVLGTVNPAREIIARAHAAGAKTLLDAAQSAPNMPLDMQALGCDFLAFSGHKICGPTGIGVLVAAPERIEEMDPFLGGGEMISKVMLDHSTWAEPPHKFEAGTPNIAGAIGMGVAIEYLQRIGMESIQAYERELVDFALERLQDVPGLIIHGRAADRGGAISFSMEAAHPHDIAHFVDRDGIAIRAGHMCAQPLMRRRGVAALSRASLYFYNTRDDVDALVSSLRRAQEFFARGNR